MRKLVCFLALTLSAMAQQSSQSKEIREEKSVEIRIAGPAQGGVDQAMPSGDVMMLRQPFPGMPGAAQTIEFVGAELAGPSQTVKGAPYAADVVSESTQVLGDGTRIANKTSQAFYRDSEGRTRREVTFTAPGKAQESHTVVFIDDPVAGVHYVLNSEKKSAQKLPLPKFKPGVRVMAPASGMMTTTVTGNGNQVMTFERRTTKSGDFNTTDLGIQSIEGTSAKGSRISSTVAAGEIGNDRPITTTTESWYSEELQTTVLSKRSDPRFGESSTRTTNLRKGEQPRYLFEVPADYKLLETNQKIEMIRSIKEQKELL